VAGDELQVQQVGRVGGHAQHLVGGAANGGNVGVDDRGRPHGLAEQGGPGFRLVSTSAFSVGSYSFAVTAGSPGLRGPVRQAMPFAEGGHRGPW
jgi:hypothetical protein